MTTLSWSVWKLDAFLPLHSSFGGRNLWRVVADLGYFLYFVNCTMLCISVVWKLEVVVYSSLPVKRGSAKFLWKEAKTSYAVFRNCTFLFSTFEAAVFKAPWEKCVNTWPPTKAFVFCNNICGFCCISEHFEGGCPLEKS